MATKSKANKKTTARKSTAKKTTAKKTTAKKTTARKSTAKKSTTKKTTARRRQGRDIRNRRDGRRAPLEGRILPGDREILRSVQAEIDKLRQPLPSDFTPIGVEKGARGEVSYRTPRGTVSVPALDFAKMQAGTMPWKQADPDSKMIRKLAQKLQKLSFLPEDCRFCHREITDQYSPEYSQVWLCLRGIFVMPYIDHELKGNQKELRFRHMHLVCSLWEDHLADLLVSGADDLVTTMTELRHQVLQEARQKRPDTTIGEVDGALLEALNYMEEEVA